jgi:hypothetical protein
VGEGTPVATDASGAGIRRPIVTGIALTRPAPIDLSGSPWFEVSRAARKRRRCNLIVHGESSCGAP